MLQTECAQSVNTCMMFPTASIFGTRLEGWLHFTASPCIVHSSLPATDHYHEVHCFEKGGIHPFSCNRTQPLPGCASLCFSYATTGTQDLQNKTGRSANIQGATPRTVQRKSKPASPQVGMLTSHRHVYEFLKFISLQGLFLDDHKRRYLKRELNKNHRGHSEYLQLFIELSTTSISQARKTQIWLNLVQPTFLWCLVRI